MRYKTHSASTCGAPRARAATPSASSASSSAPSAQRRRDTQARVTRELQHADVRWRPSRPRPRSSTLCSVSVASGLERARCGGVRAFAAQHSTAQHSTAHHSTSQHITAQHSSAQHIRTSTHQHTQHSSQHSTHSSLHNTANHLNRSAHHSSAQQSRPKPAHHSSQHNTTAHIIATSAHHRTAQRSSRLGAALRCCYAARCPHVVGACETKTRAASPHAAAVALRAVMLLMPVSGLRTSPRTGSTWPAGVVTRPFGSGKWPPAGSRRR